MGYPFDGSALPTQRAGNVNEVPVTANPLQYMDSDLVNRMLAILGELGAGLTQAPWLGLLGGTPDLSATGKARLAYVDGRLKLSREGLPWETVGPHVHEKRWDYFGIKADGSDDTNAWQAALDYFSDLGSGGQMGKLVLPPTGTSLISDTLLYTGNVGRSLIIEAPTVGGYGQSGFRLKWSGSAGTGKALLRMRGGNNCLVRGIGFDGTSLAKYLLHIDNLHEESDPDALLSSSNTQVERCSFYDHGGVDCAGIAIGNTLLPNTQTSEVLVQDCIFNGRNAAGDCEGYGIAVMTAANCKNFIARHCHFNNHRIHAHLGSSGYALIDGGTMSRAQQVCIGGGELLHVRSVDYEGTNDGSFPAPFVDGGVPTQNPGYTCVLVSNTAVAPLQDEDGEAGFNLDDVMVRWPGPLIMLGNSFRNIRSGSHESRIQCGALYDIAASNIGGAGSVTSFGNWYENSSQDAPIYDSSGNLLTGGFYGSITEQAILSIGDLGGPSGSGVRSLRACIGQPLENKRHRVRGWGDPWGATNLRSGAPVEAMHQKRLTFTTFSTGAAGQYKGLVHLNPGQRLKGCRIKVTTAFAGVAGGLTCQVGFNPSGDPGSLAAALGLNDILLPFSITATGTFGDQAAHCGVGIHPDFIQPGGYYPAAVDPSNGWELWIVVSSMAGNLLNTLSAGQMLVSLITENDD